MNKTKTTAIVLAAGQGKRMNTDIQKQYLPIKDKPVLYYSLKAFEESLVDKIVLVVGGDDVDYCKSEIVDKYRFSKVAAIVAGGNERYHSVYNGIKAIKWDCEYVFIHDGARPFVTSEIIERAFEQVKEAKACVVGMPVKDTIKISDERGFIVDTPPRANVWQVQTPQVFEKQLISSAYEKLIVNEQTLLADKIVITDDAMVVEYFEKLPVKLVQGSYENIKITTREDLKIAESFI
jgi:2-C-methyl-D-erythritol 4-phosphate cytidylyltransferase